MSKDLTSQQAAITAYQQSRAGIRPPDDTCYYCSRRTEWYTAKKSACSEHLYWVLDDTEPTVVYPAPSRSGQ